MTNIVGKLTELSTKGEIKLFTYFSEIFDVTEYVSCYYEPEINGYRPDFILFGKKFGIIILEVKDYEEDSLSEIPKTGEWMLHQGSENIQVPNPYYQMYNYKRNIARIVDKSENNKLLIKEVIIFSNISNDSLVAKTIKESWPEHIYLFFKEDVSVNEISFKENFMKKIPHNMELNQKTLDLLRANLIPLSRLPNVHQKRLTELYTPDDTLKLLDIEQEQTAQSMGAGHRLIFGVAGSGKTILLVARARYLAINNPNWRILILCYNVLLREYIIRLLIPQDYNATFDIDSFHRWAKNLVMNAGGSYALEYQKEFENCQAHGQQDDFFSKIVSNILDKVVSETDIPKYDAILIDEAQDFEQGWYYPILKLLNPNNNSLLITCDGLQAIYERNKFRWKDVGIMAQGRVKKLRKAYRNPKNIGETAFNFITKDKNVLDLLDHEDAFLSTEQFARKGGEVLYLEGNSQEEEFRALITYIKDFIKQKLTVFVLFYYNLEKYHFNHLFINLLEREGIKWDYLNKFGSNNTNIFIGTLFATKGLESDAVIIPQINKLAEKGFSRQLLYVGMTRATKYLILSSSGSNKWAMDLQSAKNQENPAIKAS